MAEGGIQNIVPDTESVALHSSLYNRHSRNYIEITSVEVCNIMTHLGYGEEIRRRRILKYNDRDSIVNAKMVERNEFRVNDISIITAGSKAEGLSCCFESDTDQLLVLKDVLCVEAEVDLHTIPEDIDVFRMDTRVYPGHCRMYWREKLLHIAM
ncbi:hypothetical protein DPMN_092878 [Dreissena polymorpha]|uniref:Uncharacterized protein n=1 Tax=Dreissena polymorpha TaxID=45954 RepID=A0A9D4L4I0_DREPO|nr:hypothetical protein DPMN_092878 [Dreissena polymorpha]